jgi:tRNA(Ile)-lysidine synthase
VSPLSLAFDTAMTRIAPAGALGLAVSGGGDSMALLHLAHDWASRAGVSLCVATVDHGLRAESAAEAAFVARTCAALGLAHETLLWRDHSKRGNLQDAAREARLGLLAGWAARNGMAAVALGHTRDDQAETLLLRLARGSGVDGLAAMAARDAHHGALWLRPLLDMPRAALRDELRGRGATWIDDPSNDNPAFDRVKARQALAHLAPLGLEVNGLAATAHRLRAARDTLDWAARQAARACARLDRGDVIFDADALSALPRDLRDRLVAAALCRVASAPYRPRLLALHHALSQKQATLHGCLISRARGQLRITREAAAVARLTARPETPWDQRWHLIPPAGVAVREGAEIRALGEAGLALCPDWRSGGLPRASLLASPAIWDGARLIAAPLAGFGPDWQAIARPLREDFFSE